MITLLVLLFWIDLRRYIIHGFLDCGVFDCDCVTVLLAIDLVDFGV